jgi:hypothetical protein
MADDADLQTCPGMHVYQLRAVIAGISPLIWRRLLVTSQTTIAELHTILQTVFGWAGEHLHRFSIHGREYGIGYDGGPWFRDDARTVRLGNLGLRPRERLRYEYNFYASWLVELRVEQIHPAVQSGKAYPRCTGGRRAGPPEGWGGSWEFTERTQPHLVFAAMRRAAEIVGTVLDADEHDKLTDVLGADRDELGELLPLLGLEQFDRRVCNNALALSGAGVAGVSRR